MGIERKIPRLDDAIPIPPARGSLREVVAILRKLPKPPTVEPREPIELPKRKRN